MLHRLRLIFALVFSFCLCLPVFAEEVSFEAHTPTIVGEGEPFRIEFTLNTKPDLFNPPASFGGFDILAGPSTAEGRSVQIINGKVTQSVSITYTYVLQGNKIGKFTIPGAVARVDGKTYTTKSQTIEVVEAEGMSQQRGNGTSSSPSSRSAIRNGRGIAADDILIRVYVNRNQVYKGQPVKATFKLYTRVPISGIEKANFPAFNGFWAQELNVDGQKWERETYKGKVYDTRIIKETLLYPQQYGKLYIEQSSMTIVAQIITEAPQTGSLFDNFFGSGQNVEEVRKNITAAPIQITVKNFPSGAPASFNGAVGQFQMQGQLDHDVMAANSSGTYQLKISGNGNLPLIQAPKVTMPSSFEQYNMKTTESLSHNSNGITGYRQFDFPFIPRAEGSYTVGPIEFSYFDPNKAQYVALSAPQVNIEVNADSTGGISGGNTLRMKEDLKILDKDIRFIRTGNPHLHRRGHLYFGSWAYWLAIVVLTAAAAGTYVVLRKRLRDLQNTTLIRNRRANKVALQRLHAALNYMTAGDERSFYEEMLKALWGYMSDKLNIPVSNLTKDNMREELLKRSIESEYINRFIEIISECEYAQYSPSASGQMTEIYNGAVKILSKFESLIKK